MNAPNPALIDYLAKFNSGLYYEAHDALEPSWLLQRSDPTHRFYKGLIQLAGAFVHFKKGRSNPGVALLNLAEANLVPFAPEREQIEVTAVLALIDTWRRRIQAHATGENLLGGVPPPHLEGPGATIAG